MSKEFIDEYEPKVEGLDKVTTKRTVSTLEAVLTTTKGDELKNQPGYMAPLAETDVDQASFEESMNKYNERKMNKKEGTFKLVLNKKVKVMVKTRDPEVQEEDQRITEEVEEEEVETGIIDQEEDLMTKETTMKVVIEDVIFFIQKKKNLNQQN